jgi:Rrf2 family protein
MSILTLPKTVQDAIYTMIFLTMNKNSKNSVSTISQKCNISKTYLAKIVQQLSNNNLIITATGRYGGVKLAKDPKDIKINDIVLSIKKNDRKEMCVIGIDECNDKVHCPIHPAWKIIKNKIHEEFSNRNLYDLTMKMKKKFNYKNFE